MNTAKQEAKYRRKEGYKEFATMEELSATLYALGYTLDHSMDCPGIVRYVGGNAPVRIGDSFLGITGYPVEQDTGRSAYSQEARRDDNYQKLKELRSQGAFVVYGKYIYLV
jgi:hypothetical protein